MPLAEKAPDHSFVRIPQARRPIENGAANVWEADPRLVERHSGQNSSLSLRAWKQTKLRVWTFSSHPAFGYGSIFAVERGNAMFVPFYSKVFLAFESGNVIGLRMMKMMSGGSGSRDEAHLMVTEKVDAMFESWCKPDGWRHGEQRRRTVPGTRRRKRETTITLDLTDVVGNGSGRAGDSHRGGSRKNHCQEGEPSLA
jgi:hypothetical protein